METPSTPCPTCGLELDPATGQCALCGPGTQSAAQAAFLELEQAGLLPGAGPPARATPPAGATPQTEAMPPAEAASQAQATAQTSAPATAGEAGGSCELGLLLFEAEEALARGAAEKAVVLASRAVKERPDSLTARALHERARRELLRGRRRDRLEARVREAEALLQAGDAAGAERIVTSALKLIPSHPVALALFTRLKERRQQAPSAEAWAEQELERLTQARARRSLETARAEMAAGRERAAMMAVRRGLRHAPDDADLLAVLRDIEGAMERAKAGHHAVHAQVRAGLDLLAHGQVDESLKVLRAVLQAEPDNVRAQEAIQQVRTAWLRRQAVAASMPPPPIPPRPAVPTATAARSDGPVVATAPRPAAAPAAVAAPAPPAPVPAAASARPAVAPPSAPVEMPPPIPRAAPSVEASPPPPVPPPVPAADAPPVSWDDVEAAARGRVVPHAKVAAARAAVGAKTIPPRPAAAASTTVRPAATPSTTMRPAATAAVDTAGPTRAIPMGVIIGAGAAALVLVVAVVAMSRRSSGTSTSPVVAASTASARNPTAARRETAPAAPLVIGGPLATADPDLRQAVETMFADYAKALETADANLLAKARADLTADERAALLAPFTGAVNAATDLRVLDVKTRGDLAVLQVLRTDVIVGGPSGAHDPVEETLHFWRRRDGWMLVR